MDNFLDYKYRRITKADNLSKKDIIKNIKNIRTVYTPIIEKSYKNKKYEKKYSSLGKKNLTFTNIDYNYNYIDISERKIKDPVLELKKGFFYNSEYSSFLSKSPYKINSEILITGINSTKENSPEKKYKNIIENKIKSSSKNLNYNDVNNLSLRKDIIPYSPISFKPLIHFNKDSFDIPLEIKRENLASFMKKSRIIRREKYRKLTLDDRIFSMTELKKEEEKIIKITKDEYFKNFALFLKFNKSLDRYLRNLEMQINIESHITENLNKQRKKLKKDVYKLNEKINNYKYEKSKYKNIKTILNTQKNGYKGIKKIDENKEDKSIFLTSTKKNKSKENILLLSKPFYNDKKEILKEPLNALYESKCNNSSKIIGDNFIKKKEENVKIKKCNSIKLSNIKKERNDYELKNIFLHFENSILNKINTYNQKKNEINELKKKLLQSKSFVEGEYYYDKTKLTTKNMKLYFLRKENKELKDNFYAIKKKSTLNDRFKNNLEKKIYSILINLNKQINIEKELSINNLFILLSLKSDEFYDKMKIAKLIYMIKIIELILSFFLNLKANYLNDPQLKMKYENVLNIVEKEKNLRMVKLKKEELKLKLEQKKLYFFKKSTKIRFFSYKKYDIKNIRNNQRHFSKRNINNKNDSKIGYQQLLTYC